MRLLLSSDTLPDASLEVLLQGCRRRALAGLELSLGAQQAHGLDERVCPIHQQDGGRCVPEDVTEIEWLRLPAAPSLVMMMIWGAAAHQMGAGLLLREPALDPPPATKMALVHGTDSAAAREAAAWSHQHGAGTCWDVSPGRLDAGEIDRVLDETMPTLAHVRLAGNGPEADEPESAGTGSLLAKLSMRGYAGTVSLVPSPAADLALWKRWLLRKQGWGCGTAAQKQAKRAATQPR